MSPDFGLLDTASFFLFALTLYFLSVLSKRLGEVLGLKKYYYIYYAGIIFTFLASIVMALPQAELETRLFGYGFFAFGLTLGLIASIKYWGWLIKELVWGQI